MTYLFFSPYTAIWQQSLPEAFVSRTLKEAGLQVTYLSCKASFAQYCIAMNAYGLTPHSTQVEKDKVCSTCINYTKLLTKNNADKTNYIHEYITIEDKLKIEQALLALDGEKLRKTTSFNEPLRKFATYNLILLHKIVDIQLLTNDTYYLQYRREYEQVLLSYYSFQNYINQNDITGVFITNSFYPTNRTVAWLAENRRIPVYWLHAGGSLHNRLHTLNIGKGHHYNILHSWLARWQATHETRAAPIVGIKHVTEHFKTLLEGKNIFVYSSNKFKSEGMHSFFDVPLGKRVILAVLSSQDERVAVETINVLEPPTALLFKTQVDWLEKLICFVKKNPDIYLIIRVHPRDFPNRRDAVISTQANLLKEKLVNLPINIKVNWPTENISLYQLATIVDICVHNGTTVGKEFSLLGIPTVNYMSSGLCYPYNLSFYGFTEKEYFEAIDEALMKKWCYKTAKNAFRWSSLELHEGLWPLGKQFDELQENKPLPIIKKIINKIYPLFLKKISSCRVRPISDHKQLLALINSNVVSKLDLNEVQNSTELDFLEEKKAIFNALKIIFDTIYSKIKSTEDFKLLEKFNDAWKDSNAI